MIYYVTKQIEIEHVFEVVTIDDVVDYFKDKDEIQIDTETEGVFNFVNEVLLLQLGDFDNQYVINFQELTPDEKCKINTLLVDSTKTKLLHNSKFDIKFLWFHGMDIVNVYDTMLAECILYTGKDTEKGFYSLLSLVKRYINSDIVLDKQTRGKIRYGITTRVIEYAANDVKYLGKIKARQHKQMIEFNLAKQDHQDIYTTCGLEMQSVLGFAAIEYNGMYLDRAKWSIVKKQVHKEVDEVSKSIDTIVHNEPKLSKYAVHYQDLFTSAFPTTNVNWSSPKQKLEVLQCLFPKIESTGERVLSRYKGLIKLKSLPQLLLIN